MIECSQLVARFELQAARKEAKAAGKVSFAEPIFTSIRDDVGMYRDDESPNFGFIDSVLVFLVSVGLTDRKSVV